MLTDLVTHHLKATTLSYVARHTGAFGAGVAVGIGLGWLTAPEPGAVLRKRLVSDLRSRFDQLRTEFAKSGWSQTDTLKPGIVKTYAHRVMGLAADYEAWTYEDLYQRAQAIGLEGRSSLNKADLIEALRNHDDRHAARAA